MKVKLSQIKISPECDQKYTIHEIEELVESMEMNELMAPIVVTHNKFIVSGHRQYEMAKFLGWEEIDVIIQTADQENQEYTVIPSYLNPQKKRAEVLNDIQQLYQNYHKSQENSGDLSDSTSTQNLPDESRQQESWYW
jgi:hypothetical protein